MKSRICGVLTVLLAALSSGAWTVTLAWNPSPGTIANYNLYYGVASAAYTNVVAAGNGLSGSIPNLVVDVDYFFAATAVDMDGLECDYSVEIDYGFFHPPSVPNNSIQIVNGVLVWDYPNLPTRERVDGFVVVAQEIGMKAVRHWPLDNPALRRFVFPDTLVPGASYQVSIFAYALYGKEKLNSIASEPVVYAVPLSAYVGKPIVFSPEAMDNGAMRIRFCGPAGQINKVWASKDLASWSCLGTATEIASGRYQFIDSDSAMFTQRFYRIK